MEKMVDKLCEMEQSLINYMNSELCSGVHELADPCKAELAGEIIDMIKDLADAKEKCYKSKYYETVTEAMEDYSEEQEGRSGYNPNRYANGRYAPAGQGRPGYYPPFMMNEHMNGPWGYSPTNTGMGTNNGSRTGSGNMSGSPRPGYMDENYDSMYQPSEPPSEHGTHYDNYRMAKRNYTKTRSPEDKKRMKEHANEYISNTVSALLEIWNNADQEQKQHIKNNMTPLINGMNS